MIKGKGEHVPVKAHLSSGGVVLLFQPNDFGIAGATGQPSVHLDDDGIAPRINVCVGIVAKDGGESPAADWVS
jgi:hypothetical protein